MKEQKGFFTELGELIDEHLAGRRRDPSQQTQPQPGRLRRALHWLTPNGGTLLLIAVLLLTQSVWARPDANLAAAPGPSATTVNYQGRLADPSGNPLDGTYGMSFSLWDASTGGNLVWGPENHAAVPVSDGLFSVGLGSQTSGGIPTSVWNGDRYLEITVGGETLSPRELIRSVPIAGMALTVSDGSITTEKIVDGAVTKAKAPYLAGTQWSNRKIIVATWVGSTDSSGIATIDISGYGFSHVDGVVVSNGDDIALCCGAVFGVYDWNTSRVRVRVWRDGQVASNYLIRVNLAIMGQY